MFKKKEYYFSVFSSKNRYYMENLINSSSYYETILLVSDENKKEYVLLFEKIGNLIPNIKNMYFNVPYHESVIFPLDLVVKESDLYHKNEIGFIYSKEILNYKCYRDLSFDNKKDKVVFFKKLYQLMTSIHTDFYLNGLDIRQIYLRDEKIWLRYNGFQSHNRNSVYKIPDIYTEQYEQYVLDFYSLIVFIFECMYEWHPYHGNASSFTKEEEDHFYAFFTHPVFIFDKKDESNRIGFFITQRDIIGKWKKTDPDIQKIFHDILTFRQIQKYSEEDMKKGVEKLLIYYEKSELFQ